MCASWTACGTTATWTGARPGASTPCPHPSTLPSPTHPTPPPVTNQSNTPPPFSKWRNSWSPDEFLLFLSDPSTLGAGGPNQNTSRKSRIKKLTTTAYCICLQAVPSCMDVVAGGAPGYLGRRGVAMYVPKSCTIGNARPPRCMRLQGGSAHPCPVAFFVPASSPCLPHVRGAGRARALVETAS